MFWHMPALSASSPVEAILDKEDFTLEELLDEEEIIQECKALNSRLINFLSAFEKTRVHHYMVDLAPPRPKAREGGAPHFQVQTGGFIGRRDLRDGAQVEQLLRLIVEEPPNDSESKRAFKFPFIACEIFTCEIDVILRTLVEDEELMNLLFSFLEPSRPHGAFLAGYFSKVVVCLMLRKTVPLMNYVQVHQDIFRKLVDLIGITSIMEVLVRLVGTDDHLYPNFAEVMQWLADSNLLEMIVEKLSPSDQNTPEVHANAAETLSAITRNVPSPLTAKICSASFVEKIFGYAVESTSSRSTLIHSLSVCISLLDPKKTAASPLFHSFRSQHLYEPPIPVKPETVNAMLPKLGDLLMLLDLSVDENVLATTYGTLKPPLGKHRLKIVEFISVLLKTGSEAAENELASSGAIRRVLDLFIEYPFNNALHHHVENIILSCLESRNVAIIDYLFRDCNLIEKLVCGYKHQNLSEGSNMPTVPSSGAKAIRNGNIGHITRIANKLVQLGNVNEGIHAHLQGNDEWKEWQASVLQERNIVENVYKWACGRPSALQDRMRDSDDEDRDYDVAALADGISNAFRYNNMYENEDAEEDSYFEDESAEVVISALRLGDDQESLFTNSNWFAFQDDRMGSELLSTPSSSDGMDENSVEETGASASAGGSSSDDEVVVGEDDEMAGPSKPINAVDGPSSSGTNLSEESMMNDAAERPMDMDQGLFGDTHLPEWVGWHDSLAHVGVSIADRNPFNDDQELHENTPPTKTSMTASDTLSNGVPDIPNGSLSVSKSGGKLKDTEYNGQPVPSLFEEDVEFVGVELEGTEKAMEQALKEGIVGEAAPLKKNLITSKSPEKDKSVGGETAVLEFNDTNYWRVEQEIGVVQE